MFTELHRLELLDEELSHRLEAMAGFRNVLAHEYAEMIPEMVHENLGRLDEIRAFVRAMPPKLREKGVIE